MNIVVVKIVVFLFLSLFLSVALSQTPVSYIQSIPLDNASLCNQNCPDGNRLGNSVPYPFGFSHHCKIQLNCSHKGEIMIGKYVVRDVTSESILVDFPVDCSRPIDDLLVLYGPNFGISWGNGLLMNNCSIPLGCAIPTRMILSRLPTGVCDYNSESVNCFSQPSENSTFLNVSKLREKKCEAVFSSVLVGGDANTKDLIDTSSSRQAAVPLQLQTVELGWWLKQCECDNLAKTVKVWIGNGSYGCRCLCDDGYAGDGFRAGEGCRKKTSPCDAGRCGIDAKVVVLIGGIIAGASLMTALASLCYCFRKRKHLLKNKAKTKHLFSEVAGTSKIPFYPYKEIERATNSFSDNQMLGTGAYGTVYAGKLYDVEWVAIKKIKHHDPESIQQVFNEIKLLSSVSHPNLVRLLGCCIENGEQILVYEFMPNGTLCQHLQRERGSGIPWTTRITIAAETARAIAYLHSATSPPIYHRDIKSSNILLDYNFRSKVADFGLSRFGITDDSHVSTAPQGTPGYVDPQYHQNFHLSDKSDVYSFGVVLVEIITAMKVVDFSRPHYEINLAALAVERIGKGRLDEIIDPFLDPNKDAWTLSSIHRAAELAFRCLAFHGDMRPSMTEVADELEQIKLSSWAPMDENIHMGSSVASSSCSSPVHGSEKSFGCLSSKNFRGGSRRFVVSQRALDHLFTMEEGKDDSPISVQEPWLSEHSSPSTNSLLGNAA